MTLLSSRKDLNRRIRHTSDRQLDGAIAFVLIAAVIVLLASISTHRPLQKTKTLYGDPAQGPVVVKLSGDLEQAGIYYLPDHTSLGRLLEMAGVADDRHMNREILNKRMVAGQTVKLRNGHAPEIAWMSPRERLALDLPIDLNRATAEDLELIPGIGEKTAARIVHFRETSGPFKKVTDLMHVPGIKEKKMARWQRYFYLPP